MPSLAGWVKLHWPLQKSGGCSTALPQRPLLPVYGLAGVLFALFLPELREDIFFLFLFGMILATALELATGVLLERIFRQKWWDYSDEPWNFQGHICLKYSLIWGVLAVICIFFANPLLVRLIDLIPRRWAIFWCGSS